MLNYNAVPFDPRPPLDPSGVRLGTPAITTRGLRPEHIRAARADEPQSFPVDGVVQLVEPLGSDTLALIRLGANAESGEMTGRFAPDAGLRVGQSLPVGLALDHFHLFDPASGVAIRGADW